MAAYGKLVDGHLQYVRINKVEKDGKIIYNPDDTILASVGIYKVNSIADNGTDYIEDNVIQHYLGKYIPTAEELLEEAKAEKLAKIDDYDKSSAVNEFYINGNSMWIDVDLRNKLRNVIAVERAKGEPQFTEWHNGIPFTFSCDMWEYLLTEVEHYAYQCLNVTEQHKYNVNALEDADAVNAYDHTSNYPTKLTFSL